MRQNILCSLMLTYLFVIHSLVGPTLIRDCFCKLKSNFTHHWATQINIFFLISKNVEKSRPISNILQKIILPYLEVESLALLGRRLKKPLSLLRENVIQLCTDDISSLSKFSTISVQRYYLARHLERQFQAHTVPVNLYQQAIVQSLSALINPRPIGSPRTRRIWYVRWCVRDCQL